MACKGGWVGGTGQVRGLLYVHRVAVHRRPPLQVLLGKFWGLMHERDRPWHRAAVIGLCVLAPPATRKLYRRLKPSSMQRVLARRSQVRSAARAPLGARVGPAQRIRQSALSLALGAPWGWL